MCAASTAENAARAKRLLEMSTLLFGNAAQKKRIEELTRHLVEELSERERNVAKKRHTENTVPVWKKLTDQANQLSFCATELEGEVLNENETVASLNVNLRAVEKSTEGVVFKRDGLQACLLQSQRGHDKVGESISHVHGATDRFSAGLKED